MKLKLNHQESHGYYANGRFFNEPKSQHGRIHDLLMIGTTAGAFKPMANLRTLPTMMQLITRMPISHTIVAGHLYLRGVDGIYCRNLCNPTK